jgi:hypothetical protein
LFCFTLLVLAIVLTGWAAVNAWALDHGWVPGISWLLGVVLLIRGRTRRGDDERPAAGGRGILVYAALIPVLDPLTHVSHDYRIAPFYAGFLAPFAWVGVTALGRGQWVRAYGAWVVLLTCP